MKILLTNKICLNIYPSQYYYYTSEEFFLYKITVDK